MRRLVGAQRAFATLAEIAPELHGGKPPRGEDLWGELVPDDMQAFFAASMERFHSENLEPHKVRQLKLVK